MNKTLIDVMLTRKSVRTYEDKEISSSLIDQIKQYLANEENFKSPFGNKVRIDLLEHGNVDTRKVIKNPQVFVVVIVKNNRESLIDAGYVFERFILFIESLGLRTCYLNSGFERESVELVNPLKGDEIMVLSSPIGFAASKKTLLEKGIKYAVKSTKRKEIDELFYKNYDREPVEDLAVREKLEYVRWAPSSVNAQPWRIVFEGDKAHFYMKNIVRKKKSNLYNVHILDIGIALFHYAEVFDKRQFVIDESVKTYDDMEYMLTVL